MDLVFWHICHLWVPRTDKLDIFIDLVGLDFVEDDAVDVFASGKNLAETAFNLLVHFSAFLRAVNQTGKTISSSLLGVLLIANVVLVFVAGVSKAITIQRLYSLRSSSSRLLTSSLKACCFWSKTWLVSGFRSESEGVLLAAPKTALVESGRVMAVAGVKVDKRETSRREYMAASV